MGDGRLRRRAFRLRDDAYVVVLAGELDAETATLVRGDLDALAPRRLVLDLRDVTNLDAACLEVLRWEHLSVVTGHPQAQRLLRGSGFDVHDTLAPALAGLV